MSSLTGATLSSVFGDMENFVVVDLQRMFRFHYTHLNSLFSRPSREGWLLPHASNLSFAMILVLYMSLFISFSEGNQQST